MPTTTAAAKALRQNRVARARNSAIKLQLKKLGVQLRKAYSAKNLDQAKTLTSQYVKALDKAAQKKIIHGNMAARKKSRLAAQLQKAKA